MKIIAVTLITLALGAGSLSAQTTVVDWGSGGAPPNGSGLPWDPSGGGSPQTVQGTFTADSLQIVGSAFNNQFGWQNFGLNYDTSGITDTNDFLALTLTIDQAPSTNTIMRFQFNDVTNGNVKVEYQFVFDGWVAGVESTWISTTNIGNPVAGTFDGAANWDFVQFRDQNNGGTTTGTPWSITLDDMVTVPEPGTYALLAGLGGLALVVLRRRK